MNIIKLEASNFKRLTAVSIAPDGNVITLTGDNGAGKSSVLDAIQSALAGGKTIPAEPIRRGEDTGQVVLTVGNLVITRRFTAGGTTLRITDAEGRVQRSPQAILDEITGNLAFDPLAFSRLKSAAQWEQLRELIGLDFKQIDADRTKAYDDRTIVGREVDRLKTLIKEIPPSVDDAPDAETPTSVVLDGLNRISQKVKAVSERDATLAEIAKVRQQITELQTRLDGLKIKGGEQQDAVDALDAIPTSTEAELKAQLSTIEATNATVRQKQARNTMLVEVKTQDDKYTRLTEHIAALDEQKRKEIAEAKFPLSELSFDGESITYKGIKFEQASDGEKLRVSVAVGMALNPKLRVIFVRDGSLLDKSGLQTIADLAAQHDYQVWLEDARSADPSAIEISDGAIKP